MRNTIILEPYTVYMTERISKRISPTISDLKQIIINKLINSHDQNESGILFMMDKKNQELNFNVLIICCATGKV